MAGLLLDIRVNDKGTVAVKTFQQTVRGSRSALDQHTKGITQANSAFSSFGGAVSSTVNKLRGLGGILGGLSFAYVGKSILDANIQLQRIENTMRAATGSSAAAATEFAFVRQTADSLGLSLLQSAKSYGQLAAAAKGTSLEGQKTRDIFLAVAQAGTAMGMSSDDMAGALKAVDQMISKGNVQAEELRGQLGERLPGAFQIAARAMGVTTQELNDMLKGGEVLATDLLPKLASELTKTFAEDAIRASGSTIAQINRLKTGLFDLLNTMGNTGVMNFFSAGLQSISGFVKSTTEALGGFSLSMESATKAIHALVFSVKLLIAYKLAGWIIAGSAALAGYTSAMIAAIASTNGMTLATLQMGAAIVMSGKAWAAFALLLKTTAVTAIIFGTVEAIIYLRKHTEVTAQVWSNLWFGMLKTVERVKVGVQNIVGDMVTAIKVRFYEVIDEITNAWNALESQMNKVLPERYQLQVSYTHTRTSEMSAENDRLKAERNANLKNYLDEMTRDQEAMKQAAYDKAYLNPATTNTSSGSSSMDKAAESVTDNGGAVRDAQEALRTVVARYEQIKEQSQQIAEIDKLRLDLTKSIIIANETYSPLKEIDALDRRYEREKNILAIERERAQAELTVANAELVAAEKKKDKDNSIASAKDAIAKANNEILSIDRQIANVPILQALEREALKRKENLELAQATSRAQQSMLETSLSLSNRLNEARINALDPLNDQVDTMDQLIDRHKLQISSMDESFSIQEQILEGRVKEAQLQLEAATKESERVELAGELNAAIAERNALELEAALKKDRLLREQENDRANADPWGSYVAKMTADLSDLRDNYVNVAMGVQSAFENAFRSTIDGASNWKTTMIGFVREVMAAVNKELASLAAKMAMLGIIKGASLAFGSFGGESGGDSSSSSSSSSTSSTSSTSSNALGNVFSSGRLIPMAAGGIVGSPTFFPMANGGVGLMGEAGPEAIMPLKRTNDGKLGVQAQGTQQTQSPVVIDLLIENYVQGEQSMLATMSSEKGKRITVRNVVDDHDHRGPIHKIIKAGGK